MSEDDLWRELVACILGSRVRFHVAHAAVERMSRANLLSETRRSSRYEEYQRDVIAALSGTTKPRRSPRFQSLYPFPRLRAKQIRAAAQTLYAQSGTIHELLDDVRDLREVRRHLASEVAGLGPKQASLFLRNIGYAAHVAVLDVHVLTYMNWIGLTTTPVKSVPTVRQYEALEDAFIKYSSSVGYTPDRLDLAVWVVIRVAKKEYEAWR
jgi:N-glycosylase/DNA lyase